MRFATAVARYWDLRQLQASRQVARGNSVRGVRGAVTGGAQLGPIAEFFRQMLGEFGLPSAWVLPNSALELPGHFRPEKRWDLVVCREKHLIAAIELKSQVGPSFGNNFNNRAEEAIGSAADLWAAYRESRLGSASPPFLGYFFLLEDCAEVHKPVRSAAPTFPVDPEFVGASYARRYELLCRRLMHQRLYSAACLTLTSSASPEVPSHPSAELGIRPFLASLEGHVRTHLEANNSG